MWSGGAREAVGFPATRGGCFSRSCGSALQLKSIFLSGLDSKLRGETLPTECRRVME
jgi:hypothetical protein